MEAIGLGESSSGVQTRFPSCVIQQCIREFIGNSKALGCIHLNRLAVRYPGSVTLLANTIERRLNEQRIV